MNNKKRFITSMLSMTTVFTVLGFGEGTASAQEAEYIIQNQLNQEVNSSTVTDNKKEDLLQEKEEKTSYIDELKIINSDTNSNKWIIKGIYTPNTELTITLIQNKSYKISTNAIGEFSFEIEKEQTNSLPINLYDQNEKEIFYGDFPINTLSGSEENAFRPTLDKIDIDSEYLTGYSKYANNIKLVGTNNESILIPIEDDASFSIKLSELNLQYITYLVALDDSGNMSDKVELNLDVTEKEGTQEDKDHNVGQNDIENIDEEALSKSAQTEKTEEVSKTTTESKQQSVEETNNDDGAVTEENKVSKVIETDEEPTQKASLFSTKATVNGTKYHYVRKGETLYSISQAYGVSVNELLKWNNISSTSSLNIGDLYSVNGYNNYKNIDKELVEFKTATDFINYIAPIAEKVAKEYNLYTSVMIAQAALESGWGTSALSKIGNNFFGVKGAYDGNSIVMLTWEENKDGSISWIQDEFRLYPTFNGSIVDNADKIRNGLTWSSTYYNGTWVENTASYRDATEWLTGRYATDSSYASKLNNIITANNLTKYDNHISISNPIRSQRYLNRVATVNSSDYSFFSQPYGTASDKLITSAENYLGQTMQIKQEKVNSATWWLAYQNGEKIGWINKKALSDIYYVVTDTDNSIRYSGKIIKPWSINIQPYGTEGSTRIKNYESYMGATINVVSEKKTDKAVYALISMNGKNIGWVDKTAIDKDDEIKSVTNKKYAATVEKAWSINSEPYGTTNAKKIYANSNEFLGEVVEVSQEKVTDRSTYALISFNGKELGWIDTTGLKQHEVLSTNNVDYTVEVTKPWSINTQPWGIEGYQEVTNASTYLGQILNVIQEKKTDKSTYVLLEKDGKTIGWIDQTGVEKNKDVLSVQDIHYVAKIQKPWSINTQPWGTAGAKAVYANSNQFLGKVIEVTQEKKTNRSTYALISLNGEELGWIDATGLEKQRVLSTKAVNYKAEIVEAWSINSQPWGIEGFETNYASATEFMNQPVDIIQEKVTPRSTYALVSLNGKKLGWIDKDALNFHPILSSKKVNYRALITKPWSINTQPWGTEGYKTIVNNASYVGKTVNIIQEKVTPRSTYVLIEVNGDTIGWIDSTGITKQEVLSTKNVNYAAKIIRPWSINSQPWGTEGSQTIVNDSSYVGKTVNIIQEKVTPKSTYVLIEVNGKTVGWIDKTGIKSK